MVALLVGTSVVAGVWLGWYGYKASLRIRAWGQGMNECDRIFQRMAEETEGTNFEDARQRLPKDGPGIAPFVTPHLRP